MSGNSNSCEYNDTSVGVAGRGLQKVGGFDFETWVSCYGDVRKYGGRGSLVIR